jgi:hypothetical protein
MAIILRIYLTNGYNVLGIDFMDYHLLYLSAFVTESILAFTMQ